MSSETTILVALLLPVAAAASCQVFGRLGHPNLRDLATPLVGVCTFAAVWQLGAGVLGGGRPELVLLEVLPGVELAFQVEPLGLLYGLVASGLWVATSIYAVGYMRGHHEKNQTRFFTYFALSIFAALGIAFARNLFTLFLFYEALTLLTFPLVTHHGTAEAAARGARLSRHPAVHLDLLPSAGDPVHLAPHRNGRVHTRRHPGRGHEFRHGDGAPAALRLRRRQGGADAAPPLAAQRDGGAHPGQRAAARGGGGQGGRVHHPQGRGLRLRPRPAARQHRLAGPDDGRLLHHADGRRWWRSARTT